MGGPVYLQRVRILTRRASLTIPNSDLTLKVQECLDNKAVPYLDLSELPEGCDIFKLGPEFGLPGSIYQTNQAVSSIYLAQTLFLE